MTATGKPRTAGLTCVQQVVLGLLVVVVAGALTACGTEELGGSRSLAPLSGAGTEAGGSSPPIPDQPLRIFWVSSYSADDPWSRQIRTGIWEALARSGYSVAADTLAWEARELDFSPLVAEADMALRIAEALNAIVVFGPDVVIVSDDEAAQAVVPALGTLDLAIVVCGLNESPRSAGDSERLLLDDVTVIVEPLRPVQTVTMAREFAGGGESFLLIGDASLTGRLATDAAADLLDDAGLGDGMRRGTPATWSAWQELVLREGPDAGFVLVAGYRPVLDEAGRLVDSRTMMAWMLAYLDAPVFSLVNSVVIDGAVGGLVADGYEQGRLAGESAVVVGQGRGASMRTGPSRLVVNAAAARHWGLQIPTLFPIAAEVYRSLPAMPSQSISGPADPSTLQAAAPALPIDGFDTEGAAAGAPDGRWSLPAARPPSWSGAAATQGGQP